MITKIWAGKPRDNVSTAMCPGRQWYSLSFLYRRLFAGVKWQRKSWPLISFQQRCWKWEDLYIHLFIHLHDIHRDFAFPCVQTLHQISGHLLHFSTFRLHCNNKLALESNSYTYQTPGYENLISSVTACDIYIEYDNAFDHCEKNCCLYLPVRVKCV